MKAKTRKKERVVDTVVNPEAALRLIAKHLNSEYESGDMVDIFGLQEEILRYRGRFIIVESFCGAINELLKRGAITFCVSHNVHSTSLTNPLHVRGIGLEIVFRFDRTIALR